MTWAGVRQPEAAAYVVTTALALVPVWTTTVFPSQDGGSHLYNAHVLASLMWGNASHYADLYTLNFAALANWGDHLILALLMQVLPPATSASVLVTGYVLAFAAAARYAAHAIGNPWVAHLSLPLLFTFSVHMGFYNFMLTLPLYLVLIGYYWQHRERYHTPTLTILLLALYMLHPLAWLFGVVSLTTLIVTAGDTSAHLGPSLTMRLRRVALVWLAASPGAILLVLLVGNEPTVATEWQPLPALLRHIYMGGPLWVFGPPDSTFGAALFALFACVSFLAARSSSGMKQEQGLAWATAGYLMLVLVLPSQWKSLGLITERVGTFAFLTWVLALAARHYPARVRTVAVVASQALALLLIARWTVAAQSLDPYVDEYLSIAPELSPARRVLELNFATRGRGPDGQRLAHPVAPFSHLTSLVGASRDAVVVNDYEALTAVFPLQYRVTAAGAALESTLHDPPDFRIADLDRFEQATCRPIDYVVIWQADADDPHTRMLLDSLAGRYELAYRSQPAGYAQVHTRRGGVPCGQAVY